MTLPVPSTPRHPPEPPPSSVPPRPPRDFRRKEGTALTRYGLAVASVVVAFLVQQSLWPYMFSAPFLAFFAAVTFSGWRGGWGPGILATALSLLTVDYFFMAPRESWATAPGNFVALGFFLVLSMFVTMLNVSLRQANTERADLLERERAARAAAEYERARLRELFMRAPAHLVIFRGPEHRFELSNPLNSSMLGDQELLGRPLREVSPRDEAERIARLLDRVYRTGEPFQGRERSLKIPQPDGAVREYIFDITYTPTRDTRGQVDGIAGFGFDVTDLVRARARAERLARELSHNEEHLRLLAGASSFLATSLDYKATLGNVVRLAVPALADWCIVDMMMEDGTFKRLEVAHAPGEDASLREPLWRPAPYDAIAPRLSGALPLLFRGQPFFIETATEESLRQMTSDPGRLELFQRLQLRSIALVPMLAGERTLGILSFATTWQSGRFYTAADLPFLQELANRAALSLENARLYREAREAVRLRDEFLSIASHELKTPLTPLNLKLQSLRRELGRTPGPVRRELVESYLDVGSRQLKKLAELVNDLLDVSRIAAGRLSLESTRVDLVELVREVVASYEGPAARAGSTLRLEVDEGVATGWWDRPRLEQVVVNLVDNAIKYGQGRPIDIRLETHAGRTSLTVRDQGIGISEESLPRLFGRFERAVSERHYGGLGLGLYITRTLVEAMGGTVRVESRLGQGSVFTVELPLRAEPPVRAEQMPPADPASP